MVSLSKSYRPSKKRSVRKRTDTIKLRLGFLATAIGVLTISAKLGVWENRDRKTLDQSFSYENFESEKAEISNRRSLASSDYCLTAEGVAFCNGQPCFTPADFPGTCCLGFENNVTSDALCEAEHGHLKECPFGDLCVAELIPGGGGVAECLQEFENKGGVVLYLFILFYLFLGLAIVCDDYFTVALDKIAEGLGVSEDVNGATFAAIGSSAPELFVSLADNVIAQPPKSVGIGTVVGSAIFNILIIIGASAIVAGMKFGELQLDWHPLSRDCSFYTLSIIFLIAVVIDGEVQYYEGLILMIAYLGYLTFMVYNQRIFAFVDEKLGIKSKFGTDDMVTSDDDVKKLGEYEMNAETGKRRSIAASIGSWRGLEETLYDDKPYFDNLCWPRSDKEGALTTNESLWLVAQRAYFIFVLPLNLVFRFTIPDSEYDLFGEDKPGSPENRKKAYWLEFTMCIVHIAVSSHFLVFAAAKFGCLVGIPPAVMGLTILAAGTSVPDAITSIILTRNNQGDGGRCKFYW